MLWWERQEWKRKHRRNLHHQRLSVLNHNLTIYLCILHLITSSQLCISNLPIKPLWTFQSLWRNWGIYFRHILIISSKSKIFSQLYFYLSIITTLNLAIQRKSSWMQRIPMWIWKSWWKELKSSMETYMVSSTQIKISIIELLSQRKKFMTSSPHHS